MTLDSDTPYWPGDVRRGSVKLQVTVIDQWLTLWGESTWPPRRTAYKASQHIGGKPSLVRHGDFGLDHCGIPKVTAQAKANGGSSNTEKSNQGEPKRVLARIMGELQTDHAGQYIVLSVHYNAYTHRSSLGWSPREKAQELGLNETTYRQRLRNGRLQVINQWPDGNILCSVEALKGWYE